MTGYLCFNAQTSRVSMSRLSLLQQEIQFPPPSLPPQESWCFTGSQVEQSLQVGGRQAGLLLHFFAVLAVQGPMHPLQGLHCAVHA